MKFLKSKKQWYGAMIKTFVNNSIKENPTRYAGDNGDLNLINDYFLFDDKGKCITTEDGKLQLTTEQHKAIASLIRLRNIFLEQNNEYDLRSRNKPSHGKQLTIFDFLDDETKEAEKKLTSYYKGDESRLQYTISRIKKSVRGVDERHIIASKTMYPLLKANPPIKKTQYIRKKVS